jgi:protein phosphatase
MPEVRSSYGLPLSVAIHSDVGRVRQNNEDSSRLAWLSDGSLFVMVADGMGGHEAGEVASGLAVRVVEEVVTRNPDGDPRERLYAGLIEANDAILDEGKRSGTRGMGTTAIAGLVRGPEVYVGQVGDSRMYHIRAGQLVWRTSDHTRVQMLLDQRQISEDEARSHPESGMLTRALGHSKMADGRPLTPEVSAEPITLVEGDALVLCSDGLHDLLEDSEIGQAIAGLTPAAAARALVELACERGGHDNVTVAVVCAGESLGRMDPTYVPETWAIAETTINPEDLPEEPAPAPRAEPRRSSGLFVGVAAFGMFGMVAAGVVVALLIAGVAAWMWMG